MLGVPPLMQGSGTACEDMPQCTQPTTHVTGGFDLRNSPAFEIIRSGKGVSGGVNEKF